MRDIQPYTPQDRSKKHASNSGIGADAAQGADEQRTEPYKQYGEGAEKSVTQRGAASSASVSGSAGKQDRTSKARILCIEDEHFISELYTRALTRAGYAVKVILDGAEGLEEAKTDKYDIILLDLMIPTMTGMEVLKRLRAEAPDLHSKVIITTNLEQKDETRAEIERQADGYVIKAEITPKQLVEFLSRIK